jgi:murein DD-endopeptidase MepM/ murein hydrolase activator NlpD
MPAMSLPRPLRALSASTLVAAISCGCAASPPAAGRAAPAEARATATPLEVPAAAMQGSLLIGRAPVGSRVHFGGRDVDVSQDGHFVVGIARDARGNVPLRVALPDGRERTFELAITPRAWPVERINGVPPATVNPPPAIAARIAAEQARVAASRQRDDARDDYLAPFVWPVRGRVTGRFGNQRVYNGSEGAPHSGMDIAASQGTPVRAPAGGVITFAELDLYLTGGTVVLDHGRGVSSNFLHLSRIDVRVGDRIQQGQVIGAVGATGRATGPHLHWGMNWFDVRIDPLLVLDRR